jgi:hypothetical protein
VNTLRFELIFMASSLLFMGPDEGLGKLLGRALMGQLGEDFFDDIGENLTPHQVRAPSTFENDSNIDT